METEVLLRDLSQELHLLLEVEASYAAGFALGRHILQYWPKHLETYVLLARATLAIQSYADAADLLQRALSANPEDGELWRGLRRAAEALELNEEAEVASRYERDWFGTETPMARALAAVRAERWSQALRHYRAIYAMDDARMDAALGLATVLWRQGRYDAAESYAEAVLTQLPLSLKAHLLLALCALRWGDDRTAQEHLRKAHELDPEHIYAQKWFGPDAPPAPRIPATLPPWNPDERWPVRLPPYLSEPLPSPTPPAPSPDNITTSYKEL